MLFPAPPPPDVPVRVVVTGVGIITALGLGWTANAEGFRAGRRAFRAVTMFDVSRQRAQTSAEVDLPESLPRTRLSPRHERRLDRSARMLLLAAVEAWEQSGWKAGEARISQVVGTTGGAMTLGEQYYRSAASPQSSRVGQATRVTHYQAQRQALDVSDAVGIDGPVTIIANACSSGANAVGHGFDLIRTGRAQRVLASGYDALSHMVFAGFDSLRALSTTSCRPFASDRDGLALGEGAAVLCLESFDSARRRDAEIVGEIIGYGAATDPHHLTQPHPQGDAALQAMTAACRQAKLTPERIDYINAHGTGTPLNDSAEASAINRWAGAHACSIPVSSTKACIGHLLGAAGAVEVVACLMALRGQWLPPELGVDRPDEACRFPVIGSPRDATLEFALTNSFGFGGSNASLVLRR